MLFFNKVLGKACSFAEKCMWNMRYDRYRYIYDIDDSFEFNGYGVFLYGEGRIEIDRCSYIGRFSSIHSSFGSVVQIGKYVSISHFVKIYTSSNVADQDFSKQEFNKDMMLKTSGNVTIGDYSWIGASVFINPGITIGSNSVVGANSVVTKNIPDNCIAAGCPAKVIKYKS